jgi:hypothetical protein
MNNRLNSEIVRAYMPAHTFVESSSENAIKIHDRTTGGFALVSNDNAIVFETKSVRKDISEMLCILCKAFS